MQLNLKAFLMNLGNKLVLEKGYAPSGPLSPQIREAIRKDRSTELINVLQRWVALHGDVADAMAETVLSPERLRADLDSLADLLVTKHQYMIQFVPPDQEQLRALRTTEPLTYFAEWVNLHPEAQDVLSEMGILWPMPKRERQGG